MTPADLLLEGGGKIGSVALGALDCSFTLLEDHSANQSHDRKRNQQAEAGHGRRSESGAPKDELGLPTADRAATPARYSPASTTFT